MPKTTTIISVAVFSLAVGTLCVYFYWWAVSFYKRKTAEPPPSPLAPRQTIWRDPGRVEQLDLADQHAPARVLARAAVDCRVPAQQSV